MSITQMKPNVMLSLNEVGVCAEEFCAIACEIDCVVNHPPCVFIKSDSEGNFAGWAISVFSQKHDEAVYLISHNRNVQLYPSLDAVMTFLHSNQVLTFNVSSAM
ncbi:hypothetical protein [Vibrio coralliilyticus]|uniref:hypothetical protein n=1 Tax=Vibrio coralliilyticus TaxID=190893 RepID=UPI00148C404C|nr:hypothetical protein [Vibrio coralliilyticus]NOI32162.1 hypothetical protein [Vibrio coralliilyticus]NOI51298.1 hypothetical protein [Vibrio coralliilyticus]